MNIIFYHSNCADGFGAAFAAWRKFGDTGAMYCPVSYGQPVPGLPELGGSEPRHCIFILDFSWPGAQLLELAERPDVESVVVLDHHASARRELESVSHPKLRVQFSEDHSGAWMAWRYFQGQDEDVPDMIRYIEDYDIHWPPQRLNTRAVQAGLWRGTMRKFDIWNALLLTWAQIMPGGGFDICCKRGRAILYADELTLAALVRNLSHVHGPDRSLGLCVNSPVLPNEIAERVLEANPLAEWVAVYYLKDTRTHLDGTKAPSVDTWKVSLRSRQGKYDVSRLAEGFGGGGHQSAAAFTFKATGPVSIPQLLTAEARECEEAVIHQIRQRRDMGRVKYGQTMERGDLSLREWLKLAQEEALDLSIYLERARREIA